MERHIETVIEKDVCKDDKWIVKPEHNVTGDDYDDDVSECEREA